MTNESNSEISFGFSGPFSPDKDYSVNITGSSVRGFDGTRAQGWAHSFVDSYYGNFGGAGYTKGQFSLNGNPVGREFSSPVDDLDRAFQVHDLGYGRAKCNASLERAADIALLDALAGIIDTKGKGYQLGKTALSMAEKAYNIFAIKQNYFPSWKDLTQRHEFTDQPCFPADTQILLADGTTKSISEIREGDVVSCFAEYDHPIGSRLISGRVTKLFRNNTNDWIELTKVTTNDNGFVEDDILVSTPGHLFLNEFGKYEQIQSML